MLKKYFLLISLVGTLNFSCSAMIENTNPTDNDKVIKSKEEESPAGQNDTQVKKDVPITLEEAPIVQDDIQVKTDNQNSLESLDISNLINFITLNIENSYDLKKAIAQLSETCTTGLASTVLKRALERTDVSLDKLKSRQGSTVLHVAARSEDELVIKIIFGALNEADIQNLLTSKDNNGRTAYDDAPDEIKKILKNYVMVDEISYHNNPLRNQAPLKSDHKKRI